MKILRLLRLYVAHEAGGYQFLVFNALALPLMLAYLGTRLVEPGELLQRWLAGCIVYGITVNGFAQVGFGALHDRFTGRLQLLRSCGVSTAEYYAVQCVSAILQGVAVAWLGTIAMLSIGLVHVASLAISTITIAAAVTAASIAGIGLVVVFLGSSFDTGNVVIGLASLGLGLASPVFFDLVAVPPLLRPVVALSPLAHATPLLYAGLARTAPSSPPLLAATSVGLVYLTLGYLAVVRRWRRDAS